MIDLNVFIPARMESSRFPGKPLAPINGLPMIVYCARNSISAGLSTYVCTDSESIVRVCDLYDVPTILTPSFNTGTDRVAFASDHNPSRFVINLQGDEPLITAEDLTAFAHALRTSSINETSILNAICAIDADEAFDPNNVKCSIALDKTILYLSRKALLNSIPEEKHPYFKQLGLYGMLSTTLQRFSNMPQSKLELAERIEMIRWLDHSMSLASFFIDHNTISVDTPEDFVRALSTLESP